ncbi:M60 family metallopeptidase [Nissabacter archeti]|uniref:M60 family metallopeptidase n=1 Tax=Nissabacter archeti TaxID=1917880 RepID=UPI0009A1D17D|nr:M60 family metallopeptidase [Nissabacter archeti]
MKGYKINRLTLAVALILSSGAASAAPENITYHGNTSGSIINFGPVPAKPVKPVIDDAELDQKNITLVLDTWWWNYQYTDGFKEAIAQLGLTIDQMTANYQEMDARAKNPNDPLFWLKRTLEIYPSHAADRYNIPVTESNTVMRKRTTTYDRNNYFLTREYGKTGEAITIKAGTIPAGVTCYAAMDGDMTLFKGTGSEKPLLSGGTMTYVMPHDGILLLGCKDNNSHMKNLDTTVPMQILSGGSQRHPLFIFGINSQRDWADFSQKATPTGYGVFFDGRSRYAVSRQRLAASADTNILKTLRENLLLTITYDKLNGMDGSSELHQPARSLFMTSYDECCWANSAGGRLAIGRYPTLPDIGNWATWHEYGHDYQMDWSWKEVQEVTVNIYSLAACYTQWGYAALNQCHQQAEALGFSWDQQAVGSAIKAGQIWNIDAQGEHFRRLNMFAQLLASYPDLYPALGKALREDVNRGTGSVVLNEKQKQVDWFAINASRFSGHDLRAFFDLWTLPYSAAAGEQIAALKLPQPAQPVATYEATLTHTGSTPTTAKLKIENNTDRKGIGFVANSEKVGPRALIWSGEDESRLHTQVVDTQNRAFTVTLRGKRAMGGCSGHAVNTAAVCGSSDAGIHLSVSYHPEDNPHLPAGDYHGTLPLIATAWGNPAWTANVNIPLSISK